MVYSLGLNLPLTQEAILSPVIRICFVCLGNIVRSPLARTLFLYHAQQAGTGQKYEVDSAGTSDWHVSEPPDLRMRRVAARRGIPHDGRARQFRPVDFNRFDWIVVMDEDNYDDLRLLDPTDEQMQKVHFLREFDPQGGPRVEVPDPYYDGSDRFELVYEVIDRSVRGLLASLEGQGGNSRSL
jgi:protein-tyrosine phosphatase